MKIAALLVGLLVIGNVRGEESIKCPDGHVNVGGKCLVQQPIKGGSQQKVQITKCKDGQVWTASGCQTITFNTPTPLKNEGNITENVSTQLSGPIPSLNILQNSLIQQLSQFTNNLSSNQEETSKTENVALLRQQPVVLIKHQNPQQVTNTTTTTATLPINLQIPSIIANTQATSGNNNITSLPLPIPTVHQSNNLFPFNQTLNNTNNEQPQILNVSIKQIDNNNGTIIKQSEEVIQNQTQTRTKSNCKGGVWIQNLNICIPQHCPPNYQWDNNTESCIQPQPTCSFGYTWNGKYCIPNFIAENNYPKVNNTQQTLRSLDCFKNGTSCIFNICPSGFTEIDSNCYPTSAQSICPQQNINSKGYCISHYRLKIQFEPTCIQGQSFWNGNYCQKIGY